MAREDRARSDGALSPSKGGPAVAIVVVLLLWASAFIAIRAVAEQLSPGPLALGRLAVGAVVLTVLVGRDRLRGRPLDLTYKEFELLKYLAQHAGRVFTRAQLLQEVWGYDFFGGTRTVDVHVRRLRAKLGAEHEQHAGRVGGGHDGEGGGELRGLGGECRGRQRAVKDMRRADGLEESLVM